MTKLWEKLPLAGSRVLPQKNFQRPEMTKMMTRKMQLRKERWSTLTKLFLARRWSMTILGGDHQVDLLLKTRRPFLYFVTFLMFHFVTYTMNTMLLVFQLSDIENLGRGWLVPRCGMLYRPLGKNWYRSSFSFGGGNLLKSVPLYI